MKSSTLLSLLLVLSFNSQANTNQRTDNYVKVIDKVQPIYQLFNMGISNNGKGNTITFNSLSMLCDGKPVLPVMGEFHFSRYPDADWRKELLKMRAGGINIVSTYVFWIHHEEVEGKYNWEGQRNLRKFIQLCNELGMPVILRIGPWCHGEVRNGGFPEWMVNGNYKLRNNNPAYLAQLKKWYGCIFQQVNGLLWKDGGAIIGLQLENEYSGPWEHLMGLKEMVREIGFDVPLYTRTGWPKLATPAQFGEIIPLYGDYADGFWDRKLTEMPGDYGKSYIFRSFRGSTVIATEQLPKHSGKDEQSDLAYPYFTCELGGGMMASYHRRIKIDPMDVYSMALVRVGSGSNLPGYYMYHGGTNPDGELTTLNERQTSNYTFHNDLPIKSYDFQAPLGEFGQVNPHYHLLRRLHLFLKDFGSELTSMASTFPEGAPTNFKSDSTLRWCVRSDGHAGYIFVNNYHRLKTLSPKKGVQFNVDLLHDKLKFPSLPITVPSNSSFFWPFNMSLNGLNLAYATAQPIAKLNKDNVLTVVFAACNGIPAEFAFDGDGLTIESSVAKVQNVGKRILFTNIKPSTEAVLCLRDAANRKVRIVLLSEENSLSFWKEELAGEERFFLTSSELTCDGNKLQLDVRNQEKASVLIYPAPKSLCSEGSSLKGTSKSLFTCYEVKRLKPKMPKVIFKSIQAAGIVREVELGKAKVAMQPEDSDFERAAVWSIQFPDNMNFNRDLYLNLSYVGDVARVYLDNKLLTDNFYNGNAFEIGLKRFAPDIYKKELILKILPLRQDAPIYLPQSAHPDFRGKESVVAMPKLKLHEKQMVVLQAE